MNGEHPLREALRQMAEDGHIHIGVMGGDEECEEKEVSEVNQTLGFLAMEYSTIATQMVHLAGRPDGAVHFDSLVVNNLKVQINYLAEVFDALVYQPVERTKLETVAKNTEK